MNKTEKRISAIVEDMIFVPNSEQVQVKVKFWHKFSQMALADTSNITKDVVLKYTDDNRINSWWKNTGFRDWFLNEEEFVMNMQYLAYKALNTLSEILGDETAQASARVNAAKLVLEAADKMPKRWEKEKYKDDKIQNMDEKQLDEFISKRLSHAKR